MSGPVSEQHGRNGYKRRCRCDRCRAGQKDYIASQRGRKRQLSDFRQLSPVPAAPATDTNVSVEPATPCVAAVRAELAALGDLTGRQGLAAAAVAMARILDHPGAVTTQPSAARQLMSLLDALHKSVAPQRGRLAAVQEMSVSSRPDAR